MRRKLYLNTYAMALKASVEAEIGTSALDFAAILKEVCRDSERSLKRPDDQPVAAKVELGVFADIRPFVEPEAFQSSPIAVAVAAESVQIFRSGHVSNSVAELAEVDIRSARAAYVDLPHGSFPVGESLQVGAILAAPEHGGRLRVTAAVGQRGSNKAMHFSWLAGDTVPARGGSVGTISIRNDYFVAYRFCVNDSDASRCPLSRQRPRQLSKLMREVERVIFLAVAQHRSLVDGQEDGDLEVLPHIGLGDPRRRTGNRKRTEREYSFFRIKRLPHLRGVTVMAEEYRDERIAAQADLDCTPTKLIDVRPFYRMQAYGPQHSLRRLIWVPAHRRRIRDDGRVDMVVLPPADA